MGFDGAVKSEKKSSVLTDYRGAELISDAGVGGGNLGT